MTVFDPEDGFPGRAGPFGNLAWAARRLADETDPAQALWTLVCLIREHLEIDRAGVFAYDPARAVLSRVAGVDPNGQPEFGGRDIAVTDAITPLLQVARRELPYYFTDDAPRDYPHCYFLPGVRAHAIIPIIACGTLVGVLCVDNALTGRPIPEAVVPSLFLYAGLAAIPLFARYQQQEQERLEQMRWSIYREVLFAMTGGKIRLCDRREIEAEWPHSDPIPIQREEHVRDVRRAAEAVCRREGMDEVRAADFVLCASEAATNALLHGNGGFASVDAADGRIRVRVVDQGRGIDPRHLTPATLVSGWSTRQSLGLGFTVIRETADCIYLYTGPGGTTLIVEMAIARDAAAEDPLSWGNGFPGDSFSL